MKPTIFFSHSSHDKELILPIKEQILEKTGNAVQIFMSSDGASIPFGKNWLKEIEDALERCKLMFSWVTPNSINSNWLYFESGYSYSRGINVVPVGIDGVNLEDFAAPLNFLQGFNVNSSSGLNNMIATINKEFGLTFPKIFDDEFFNKKIIKKQTDSASEVLEYATELESHYHPKIAVTNSSPIALKENWPELVQGVLNENNQSFTLRKDSEIYGVGFKVIPLDGSVNSGFTIKIDPIAINALLPILSKVYKVVYSNQGKGMVFRVKLKSKYDIPHDNHIISSRLINSEIDYETEMPNYIYKFRNTLFRIGEYSGIKKKKSDSRNEIILIVDPSNEKNIPLVHLIKLLLDRKIIISEA